MNLNFCCRIRQEQKKRTTDKTDIRLVYQMNDTIESFLVFKEARMTGTYKEDYEGAIEASFYRDGDDYALVVRQEEEDCVVTILFKNAGAGNKSV